MAKDLTAALHALTMEAQGQTTREERTLPAVKEVAAIPARTGQSANEVKSGGGGGIASPLVETAYASRTFHPTKSVLSTDGLFALMIKPVKTISFLDAKDNPVVIEFKAPT